MDRDCSLDLVEEFVTFLVIRMYTFFIVRFSPFTSWYVSVRNRSQRLGFDVCPLELRL